MQCKNEAKNARLIWPSLYKTMHPGEFTRTGGDHRSRYIVRARGSEHAQEEEVDEAVDRKGEEDNEAQCLGAQPSSIRASRLQGINPNLSMGLDFNFSSIMSCVLSHHKIYRYIVSLSPFQ